MTRNDWLKVLTALQDNECPHCQGEGGTWYELPLLVVDGTVAVPGLRWEWCNYCGGYGG